MSVNGDATNNPSPSYIKTWVQDMQYATGGIDTQIKYNLNGLVKFKTDAVYQTQTVQGTGITLPKPTLLETLDGTSLNSSYWCWKENTSATTVTCNSASNPTAFPENKVQDFLAAGGVLNYSVQPSSSTCSKEGMEWIDDKGCVCQSGYKTETGINCVPQ